MQDSPTRHATINTPIPSAEMTKSNATPNSPSPRWSAPDPRAASLGELYPFHTNGLNVDGQRMHYVDEGSGSPIVMVHGNPTWSFYYRTLISGLADRHRVIAPDHIGCGLSDKPRDYPYTLSTHINNLTRLLDHLDLHDVTLVVHDWGGPIGLGWAVEHFDRVRRLVIFNTAAFVGGRLPLRIRLCRWPIVGHFAVVRLNGFARLAKRMAMGHPDRMTRQIRQGYLLPYDTPDNRRAILRFVEDAPLSPRDQSFARLQQIEKQLPMLRDRPMTIFWGMKDFCFTSKSLDQWTRRFPNAEVHRFADAGHYLVEDAHERILPILRDRLSPTQQPIEPA